jgi:hypothetical protein
MKRADIRLDILIKREEDYYLAHCLQCDIVATDDSLVRVSLPTPAEFPDAQEAAACLWDPLKSS